MQSRFKAPLGSDAQISVGTYPGVPGVPEEAVGKGGHDVPTVTSPSAPHDKLGSNGYATLPSVIGIGLPDDLQNPQRPLYIGDEMSPHV
jgi:hypothetical protein